MYVVGYHSIQTFSRNGEAASQQFNQAVGLQPEPSLLLHNHHHKAAFNTFREDVHRNRQEGDRGDFIFKTCIFSTKTLTAKHGENLLENASLSGCSSLGRPRRR